MNDMLKIEVLRNAFVACGIEHKVVDIKDIPESWKNFRRYSSFISNLKDSVEKPVEILMAKRGIQMFFFPFDENGNYIKLNLPPLTTTQLIQGQIG